MDGGTTDRCWVTVPTRGDHPDLLAGIVETVGVPPGRIVVVETVPDLDLGLPAGVRRVVDCGPVNIQRWWRRGLNVAESYMGGFCLVLNDDVTVEPDTLSRMLAALLDADADLCWCEEDWTALSGWAWLLRLASPVRPDERFAWYFGDNDLHRQAGPRVARVAAGVKHLHPTETTSQSRELQALAEKDGITFRQKWR